MCGKNMVIKSCDLFLLVQDYNTCMYMLIIPLKAFNSLIVKMLFHEWYGQDFFVLLTTVLSLHLGSDYKPEQIHGHACFFLIISKKKLSKKNENKHTHTQKLLLFMSGSNYFLFLNKTSKKCIGPNESEVHTSSYPLASLWSMLLDPL